MKLAYGGLHSIVSSKCWLQLFVFMVDNFVCKLRHHDSVIFVTVEVARY
jgi:hypothetical protein